MEKVKTVFAGIFVSLVIFLCVVTLMSSCSYSVVLNHTDGTATDLVDTDQQAKTAISIPLLKK
jgi:hypothetical protein